LVKPGVDHFHARITQRAGDHLGTAIVTVKSWLRHNNSKWIRGPKWI
jgi:hypothetical protein